VGARGAAPAACLYSRSDTEFDQSDFERGPKPPEGDNEKNPDEEGGMGRPIV